jgi:plastocyanin
LRIVPAERAFASSSSRAESAGAREAYARRWEQVDSTGRRCDLRSRLVVLAAVLVAAAALVTVGVAATMHETALPKLKGTIGPGYTISLKNAQGKRVTTLKHGKYTLVVQDKANIHNFTLNGPGIKNKMITGTSFVGPKTVTVTLKAGKYRYYCTVHPFVTGTFKVT